jgi:glycosyltransferase involved in cell wall biosynthesis
MTRDELNAAFISQRIVAVNQLDADLIKSIGFGDVEILGHVQTARQAPPGWESRHGLLFLASIPDEFSPNLDALSWFSAKVLPILDSMLPPDAKVAVAGNIASKIDLSLLRRNRRVEILGRVDDLAALYDRYRVFIAPTRFAGGIPYKIHEAAAHGIPIVASKLLCHQVGWTEGKDIASASIDNPQQFADAIVGLYANQQTWTAMQASALERIRNENAPAHYTEQLAGILSRVFA